MSRALRRGTPLCGPATSKEVKRRALELGADLCGIASAATLNAFPPDPRWPQTPERISAITLAGGLLGKRPWQRLSGAVEEVSDNERYGTETISGDQLAQLHIVGRVVWQGRRI